MKSCCKQSSESLMYIKLKPSILLKIEHICDNKIERWLKSQVFLEKDQ